jgi:hypothetical protein
VLKAWRTSRQQHVYLALFVLHFLLIATISCRDIVWLVAHKLTILPSSFRIAAEKVEPLAAGAIGAKLSTSNPFRRALLTYLHVAGIDRGYGYFAPNVPAGYKLVFELHYPDGRVEYELPEVNSAAAGLRVATLLDEIGRTRYDPLREYLIKTLAASVWRDHPGVKTIRAVFGSVNLPSPAEFERCKRESYDFLYAYDFSRAEEPAKAENH